MSHANNLGSQHAQQPTTVVNLRNTPFDIYIGRAGRGFDGYFGNPYRRDAHGDDAIRLFKEAYFLPRLARDPEFRRRVLELGVSASAASASPARAMAMSSPNGSTPRREPPGNRCFLIQPPYFVHACRTACTKLPPLLLFTLPPNAFAAPA